MLHTAANTANCWALISLPPSLMTFHDLAPGLRERRDLPVTALLSVELCDALSLPDASL